MRIFGRLYGSPNCISAYFPSIFLDFSLSFEKNPNPDTMMVNLIFIYYIQKYEQYIKKWAV